MSFAQKTPAYICRSTINSVALTGYVMTRHDKPHVCILSMHSQIKTKGEFDLLMNRGSGAKIEWQYWEKAKIVFTHIDGAVATINGGSRVSLQMSLNQNLLNRNVYVYFDYS